MNQPVPTNIATKHIDRLLDELEQLSRTDCSEFVFLSKLLQGLAALLASPTTAFLTHLPERGFVPLLVEGNQASIHTQLLEQIDSACKAPPDVVGQQPSGGAIGDFYYYCIRLGGTPIAVLLVELSKSIPASVLADLVGAFAEIVSQRVSTQKLHGWTDNARHTQECLAAWQSAENEEKASRMLVDTLRKMANCDRVSLLRLRTPMGPPQVIAISGANQVHTRGGVALQLQKIASQIAESAKPVCKTVPGNEVGGDPSKPNSSDDAANLMGNYIGFPWVLSNGKCKEIVLLEWADRNDLVQAYQDFDVYLPILTVAWKQQQRWLHLPPFARRLADGGMGFGGWIPWTKRIVGIAVCIVIYFLLQWPYPMTIVVDGVVEPVVRRAVHATADGFVQSILVEEGSIVKEGDVLIELRSPELEIQWEELLGKIQANNEKRNGLKVAINQIDPSTSDSTANQTRLSADLAIVEIEDKNLSERLAFLKEERKRLSIRAPIEGLVISRQIKQQLESRPVRRGDSLLELTQPQGDWQIRLDIDDRDTGYAMAFYRTPGTDVDFTLENLPHIVQKGKVREVARSLENPSGKGAVLPLFADIPKDVSEKCLMGAKAKAALTCGSQPLWFVWSRPLVETLQKRFWFLKTASGEAK